MTPTWLYVVRGNDQGRRFEINSSRKITMGRGKSNLIRLIDEEASRAHAEVVSTHAGIRIRDLGSSNGTFVNGIRITEQVLNRGDQIEIGQTTFLVAPAPQVERETVRGGLSSSISADVSSDSSVSFLTSLNSERLVGSVKSDLQFMYHAALATSHASEVDQMLGEILNIVFEWVDVERGCVLLWNAKKKKYESRATRYRSAESKQSKLRINKSIIKYVVERKEGILTNDAGIDDRLGAKGSVKHSGVKEAMCVPIRGRSFVQGFIYADTMASPSLDPQSVDNLKLNQDHLKLLMAIGNQVAVFIENDEYYSALLESERQAVAGKTLASLSHHVKNILQSINGGTHLIEDGLDRNDVDVIKNGWAIVKRNQRNLSNLVMDMVSFSKPVQPHWKTENLNQTIEEVIRNTLENSGPSTVKIRWKPNPESEIVFFDAVLIARAVENVFDHLLDNRQSDRDDEILITSRIRNRGGEDFVYIEIQDNFRVLTIDQLEQLFEPFPIDDENEIHGIGLAVARKILNEHDGAVDVSRRKGRKGLLFTLFFPVHIPFVGNEVSAFRFDDAKGLTDTI